MRENSELKILNINDILPNRFQPRLKFEQDSLEQLAESIGKFGVIEPIVVRPIGSKFEIIAGERRYKASKLAGKSTIPAIIITLSDKDSEELALLENVQRQSLNPIEEAVSYKRILDSGYITREELAKKIGKPQTVIFNKIRLLDLSDEVQSYLLNNKISERHARSLLKISNLDNQVEMLHRIVNERLTVKQTDREIRNMVETFSGDSKEDVELLSIDERGNDMDLDKIMQDAKDINATNTEPQVMPNLMATGDETQSSPVVSEEPTATSLNINNDNRFINPASNEAQQVQTEVTTNDGASVDNVFNKPLTDDIANNLPFNANPGLSEQSSVSDLGTSVAAPNDISSVVADAFKGFNSESLSDAGSKFINIPDTSIQETSNIQSSLNNSLDVSAQQNVSSVNLNNSADINNIPVGSAPSSIIMGNSPINVNEVPVNPETIVPPIQPVGTSAPISDLNEQSTSASTEARFAQIVQMLRDCANQIEKTGHFVNVDEMDLGNQYKVTFTIDK